MAATTTVIGNITQDIELRSTQAGKAFCGVTVAVNDRRRNRQTGEMEDGPTWFARGTLWGEMAEHVAQSLGKGSRVIGHGRIVQREFEHQGQKRSAVEIEFDAFGPDLRWATATVVRAQQGGSGAGSGAGMGDWSTPTQNGAQGGDFSGGGSGDFGQPF